MSFLRYSRQNIATLKSQSRANQVVQFDRLVIVSY